MESDTILEFLETMALNAVNKGDHVKFTRLAEIGRGKDPKSIARIVNLVQIAKKSSQEEMQLPVICLRQIYQELSTLLLKRGGIDTSCVFVMSWANFRLEVGIFASRKEAKASPMFIDDPSQTRFVLARRGTKILASIRFSRMVIEENIACLMAEQNGSTFTSKAIRHIPNDLPKDRKVLIFRHPRVLENYDKFYKEAARTTGQYVVAYFWPNCPPGISNFSSPKKALFAVLTSKAPMAFIYERSSHSIIRELYPESMW